VHHNQYHISDINLTKAYITFFASFIYTFHICWKKLISNGNVLSEDILTKRPGDVFAILMGMFWFVNVSTGHCFYTSRDIWLGTFLFGDVRAWTFWLVTQSWFSLGLILYSFTLEEVLLHFFTGSIFIIPVLCQMSSCGWCLLWSRMPVFQHYLVFWNAEHSSNWPVVSGAAFVVVAMQSELPHETLDRQNQAMTENLAMKVSRLRDVRCCYCAAVCCVNASFTSLCKCMFLTARCVEYCKTCILCVCFISHISRPWLREKNNRSQIFKISCYFSVLFSPASKNARLKGAKLYVIDWTAKILAAKIKGFTIIL